MLNLYQPNVKATITFLRLLKVRVNKSTVNETLQNHPDWPSLLCISDALIKWKIPNGAGKIDISNIDQLPIPFMAHILLQERHLAVVTKVTETEVGYYLGSEDRQFTETRSAFLDRWGGTYFIAEPTSNSGEENYKEVGMNLFINSAVPAAFLLALIGFTLFLFRRTIETSNNSWNHLVGAYVQYLIQIMGILVTSLLLWYEIDKNNPLLKKVCTGITKGNCEAILTSKQSKVFGVISWSEIGFFYFLGGLLILLFAESNEHVFYSNEIVLWINLFALPYPFFSIYYQWRIAKQWCALCLTVQILLLLGAANVFMIFSLPIEFHVFDLPFLFYLKAALIYLMPVLLWYTIKPHLLHLQERKSIKRNYLQVKFNTDIFYTILKKQKPVNTSTSGLGVDLGTPSATNELIKICNPYCGPCSKSHPKLERLLTTHKNLRVKIIFSLLNDDDNIRIFPVRHLLALSDTNDTKILRLALDDWYLPERKDYAKFAKKYPMNGELSKQDEKIEAMTQWCRRMKVNFTPTFFFNGYQLPDAYNIEDLEYFLAE